MPDQTDDLYCLSSKPWAQEELSVKINAATAAAAVPN